MGPCPWTIRTSTNSCASPSLPITRRWCGTELVSFRLRRLGVGGEFTLVLIDTRTARALITVLLFALALGFLYVARATLIAFLFAIFFAYLLSPLVNRLEKVLRGRERAIAVIYFLLVVLAVAFFFLVVPKVTRQGA